MGGQAVHSTPQVVAVYPQGSWLLVGACGLRYRLPCVSGCMDDSFAAILVWCEEVVGYPLHDRARPLPNAGAHCSWVYST